ncbi:MAG TPA: class I SAM-dependent methyltransferase [Leptospiraceae bacterium]|nr:class I SAM-dependent methyltransferase [Leptospiraceae bacterium]HMY65393.1 class I SAM-dependent methyltransferase [Leptospiraceae bacterium]HNF12271.1 class I SAM-dependent methyltransferase [Leptospiraceae bacterium]HNF24927.1 class I SAM-dependent methyltransferase [Leptospiraceae bacterium]HNH10580.1 class I SAM-dependent methyltransferase [Leptospiraceae bacterium]
MDLKEEEILKDKIFTHWYYVSKWNALKNFVRISDYRETLDIGAGSGIFTKFLQESSSLKKSVCLDIGYSTDFEETYKGRTIEFRRSIDKSDADLVLMMDVLEHIPDDAEFLKQYVSKIKPGTDILISVPAFQFLFSGHDYFLEHCRRYNSKTLINTVEKSGLTVIRYSYFFGLLFPLIAVIRLFGRLKLKISGRKEEAKSDLKLVPPFLNTALIQIHRLELPFFKWNRIAGLTLFCLARKK